MEVERKRRFMGKREEKRGKRENSFG